MTEQHHTKSCDINRIMAKYVKTGLIDHVSRFQGTYGDVKAMEFQDAENLIAEQRSIFEELPAEIRKRFDNDPYNYLKLTQTDEGVERLKQLLKLKPDEIKETQTDWVQEEKGEGKPVT